MYWSYTKKSWCFIHSFIRVLSMKVSRPTNNGVESISLFPLSIYPIEYHMDRRFRNKTSYSANHIRAAFGFDQSWASAETDMVRDISLSLGYHRDSFTPAKRSEIPFIRSVYKCRSLVLSFPIYSCFTETGPVSRRTFRLRRPLETNESCEC